MSAMIAADPQFIRDSFWPDGMIRVSGREYNGLIESPCFKDARTDSRKMSCFSCHVMHKSEDDTRLDAGVGEQPARRRHGRQHCMPAVPQGRTRPTSPSKHTRHAPSSTGSSCYNCHMPYTTYGLLKTLRSHQISSPSVATSVSTGRPNACNLCHLDKTLKWTAERAAGNVWDPGTATRKRRAGHRRLTPVAASWRRRTAGGGGAKHGLGPRAARVRPRLDGAVSDAASRRSLRGAQVHRRSLAAIDTRLRRLRYTALRRRSQCEPRPSLARWRRGERRAIASTDPIRPNYC